MVADAAVRADIRDLFEGLVPVEVIDAYDRLLASDGCAKDQAETLVGDASLVSALTGWGMAHVQPHSPTDPAWFRPASPDLALQGVLAGHQNRLARDQERLLDGHRRLADAQSKFGIGMNGRFPTHLVSVVSDRAEISELSAALMNTARKDWMTLETLDTEMPLTDDFAQPPLPALGGAVRCRSIYAASAMDDPAARRIIETCTEAGEQARLLPARADEDETRRPHHRDAPAHPGRDSRGLGGPGAGHHRRAARVLRAAVGTRNAAQGVTACGAG